MRKYILLLFLMPGLFWSCSDGELVTPGDEFEIPLAPGTFSVEIDGELTDFSETTSVISNDASTHIDGANENGQSINIKLASAIEEGNYNQGAGAIISLTLDGSGIYTNINADGQFLPFNLKITELDMFNMVVSGIFSGKVYNTVTEETFDLTNGQFVELPFTLEEGGDGILRANFGNGTDTVLLDFSSNAHATGLTTSAQISGENVDQIQTLSIWVPDGIEAGTTYTEADEVVIQVNLGTSDNPSDVYTNYDAANDVYLPFNLVITTITADVGGNVIGTFSGTIQKFSGGNDEQIEITNGEINVPITVP